jgi:hypothetical protein
MSNAQVLWERINALVGEEDACANKVFALTDKNLETHDSEAIARALKAEAAAQKATRKAWVAYERAVRAEARAAFLAERFEEGAFDRHQQADLERRLSAAADALEAEGIFGLPGAVNASQWLLDNKPSDAERLTAETLRARMIAAYRTNPLVVEAVERLWALVPHPKPPQFSFEEFFFGYFDVPLPDGPQLDCAAYRFVLAMAWPGVLEAWRKEAPPLPRTVYRHPMLSIGRGLAGRAHGQSRGLAVDSPDGRGRTVELIIPIKGRADATLDLSLAVKKRVRSRPDDFEADGTIKQDALLRWVNEAVGPQVSRMLGVGFALTELDAQEEGRPANGSFWWSPTRVADLLGYKRESNGPGKTRIPSKVTAAVRRDFETLASIVIRHPVFFARKGAPQTFSGAFFSPLRATLENTTRQHGQRGRDRQTLWQILPPLFEWSRRHFISTPIDLLNAGGERPDVWANCIRLWEILAGHARRNAAAGAGNMPLLRSFESLASEANLWPEGRRVDTAAHLLGWAQKLAARGYLDCVSVTTLADGKTPALAFLLSADRRAELAQVAAGKARRALAGRRAG